MTNRNEVRIDIEVEGGARAEKQFSRAEKGARGLGRSTRGLINPLLGAGLVSGILGGGLLSMALSSGAASNSLIRIQGSLENIVGTITRSLEPAIDFAAGQFEKLPIGAQLGVLASTSILGVLLAKGIIAAAGGIATATTALAVAGINIPLAAGALSAVTATGSAIATGAGTVLAAIASVSALAIAATVLALGAVALLSWDLIFNDGRLLARFEEWLLGYGWIAVINDWVNKYFDDPMIAGWNKVVESFGAVFVQPYVNNWEKVRDYFDEDFTAFFTETIPGKFKDGWDAVIGFFDRYFVQPFTTAWETVRDFFKEDFTGFFVDTIPGVFTSGWDAVVGFFNAAFVVPFLIAWFAIKDFFEEDFVGFFTETIPNIFTSGWDAVVVGFVGFSNTLIEGMNTLIRTIGKLPIPTVSIGLAYRNVGPLSVPYPTFSVSTRPLSSFISLPQIPTIPERQTKAPRVYNNFDDPELGSAAGNTAPMTVNYYSLSALDFRSEVESVINGPGAQARAVGAP